MHKVYTQEGKIWIRNWINKFLDKIAFLGLEFVVLSPARNNLGFRVGLF